MLHILTSSSNKILPLSIMFNKEVGQAVWEWYFVEGEGGSSSRLFAALNVFVAIPRIEPIAPLQI